MFGGSGVSGAPLPHILPVSLLPAEQDTPSMSEPHSSSSSSNAPDSGEHEARTRFALLSDNDSQHDKDRLGLKAWVLAEFGSFVASMDTAIAHEDQEKRLKPSITTGKFLLGFWTEEAAKAAAAAAEKHQSSSSCRGLSRCKICAPEA